MKPLLLLLATALCCWAKPASQPACGVPAVKPNTTTTTTTTSVSTGANIYDGFEAVPYSWPWQVALLVNDGPVNLCWQMCTGALISDQWVLTSGMCVTGYVPHDYTAKLGVFAVKSDNESGEVVLNVTEFQVYPGFDPNTGEGVDIGLIKLEKPVQFTDHISPICLPSQDEPLPADGSSVFVTGWGLPGTGVAQYSENLRQVGLPVSTEKECTIGYGSEYIKNETFCLGQHGADVGGPNCNDWGAPAVYQDPNTGVWKQVGIFHNPVPYLDPGYTMYTQVSTYIDFIQQYVTGV